MQIIILRSDSEDLAVVEVPEDAETELLLQLAAAETGKSMADHYLEVDGMPIPFGQKLIAVGVYDGSTVTIKPNTGLKRPLPAPLPDNLTSGSSTAISAIRPGGVPMTPAVASSSSSTTVAAPTSATATSSSSNSGSGSNGRALSLYDIPADVKPEDLLAICQNNPHILTQLQNNDPELAKIIQSNQLPALRMFLMKRFMDRHNKDYEKRQDFLKLAEDPMNPELQKKIEEQIRLENIQANMEAAIENLPEAFGRVTMLYVQIAVNNTPLKAFVDSGAQSTIMSMRCAEQCHITHLIDTRFAGQARGVGTAKIHGRVHIAQMRFGHSVFPISITILENNDVDFLFGLDTLRRYRCNIDLAKNVLRIDGVNGSEEISFVNENELPENAKNSGPHTEGGEGGEDGVMDVVEGKDGTDENSGGK